MTPMAAYFRCLATVMFVCMFYYFVFSSLNFYDITYVTVENVQICHMILIKVITYYTSQLIGKITCSLLCDGIAYCRLRRCDNNADIN